MRRSPKHRLRDSGFAEALELLVAREFFDAKVGRIGRMRVDQNRRDPGAAEHCGGRRAGKAAADDYDISVFHGWPTAQSAVSLRREGK
jgi:hypothetical protein